MQNRKNPANVYIGQYIVRVKMTKRVQKSKRESNAGNIILNVIKRIRLGTYYSLQSHQLCKTRDSIRIFKKKNRRKAREK